MPWRNLNRFPSASTIRRGPAARSAYNARMVGTRHNYAKGDRGRVNDKRRLIKALRDAQIPPDYHWRMAAILLAVNGIDNALEFVDGLVDKGLAGVKQLEMWEGKEDGTLY